MNLGSRPNPRRRAFLAASVGAVAGLTGCLGDQQPRAPSDEGSPTTPDGHSGSPSPGTPGTDSTDCDHGEYVLDGEATADPGDFETAFGDCPAPETVTLDDRLFWEGPGARLQGETLQIVCSTAVSDDAPIQLVAETEDFEPPGVLAFSHRNRTSGSVRGNFAAWRFFKRIGSRWYPLTRHGHVSLHTVVRSNEAHRWCVEIDNSSHPNQLVRMMPGNANITNPALGAGEYAFGNLVSIHDDDEELASRVVCFARFTIVGDPISLTPSGHLENVTVRGARAEAHWTVWENERHEEGTYIVEKIDDPDGYQPTITEQIIRNNDEPLRDALVLFEEHDVDVVEITGHGNGYPPARWGNERTIEFDGAYYQISTEW